MRYFFLVIMSVMVLVSGCGKNTSQNTDNGGVEKPESLEGLETFIEAKQEKETVYVTLVLQNNSSNDAALTFSSGQQFEITVLNDENEEVYRFSKDKAFTQAIETKVLEAGSQMKWEDAWEVSNLQPGQYRIKGQITISEASPQVSEDQLSAESSIQVEENEVKENTAFRNIKVTGQNGEYVVTGEARVFEAVFHYRVSDGHSYLIDDYKQANEGAPSWSQFQLELSLNQDQLPEAGTLTLELFEKSAKDGNDTNQLFISLESF